MFDKVDIEGGLGTIEVLESRFNDLDLEAGIGKIDLSVEITGEANIEAGIGEFNLNLLGEKENYHIMAEKGIGSISINRDSSITSYGSGQSKIKIKSGIGSVNVIFDS